MSDLLEMSEACKNRCLGLERVIYIYSYIETGSAYYIMHITSWRFAMRM